MNIDNENQKGLQVDNEDWGRGGIIVGHKLVGALQRQGKYGWAGDIRHEVGCARKY